MRFGAVPYLNAIPLIHGLPWEVRKAPPATLDRLLKIGELDLATAPIVTLFENPGYSLVPGVAIGSGGPVKSVRLVFQKEGMALGDLRSIYLDMESRTSVILLKVLLHYKYKINLEKIRFDHPLPGPDPDAMLLIGNKAMENPPLPTLEKGGRGGFLDLGAEWTSWTGLPFVFAAWIGRSDTLSVEIIHALNKNCHQNLKNLDQIVTDQEGFSKEEIGRYLSGNVSYTFGEEEIGGMRRFHAYSKELGLIHHEFRPHFYPLG